VSAHVEIERKIKGRKNLNCGKEGRPTMMLLVSIVIGIIPLLGIAWTIATGTITTVDGLFMSLILLTLSGVFFLNAYWELRDRGVLAFLHKKKVPAAPASAPAKTASAVASPTAPKPLPKTASENKGTALEGSEG
jgi:hypothetical protein